MVTYKMPLPKVYVHLGFINPLLVLSAKFQNNVCEVNESYGLLRHVIT